MRGFLPFYRAVSLSAAVVAGALAALALGGADQFDGFKNPPVSFVSSHKIGFTAGLSSPDDTGRRYLIGVAAAAQSGVFAVWIGIAFVLGFPDQATTVARIATLLLNIVAIGIAAGLSHALVGVRRKDIHPPCGTA